MTPQQESTLIAAAQASEAATELLRYTREGPYRDLPFEGEVVEKLTEALLISAELELVAFGEDPCWAEDREILGQLIAACRRYIEGWAG